MSYLRRFGTRRVPQSVPIPGSGQVPNSAGGHARAVDDWIRLRRFLILGSEGGSYYAAEAALTRENADAVDRCLAEDGPRTVAEIVRVSDEGRAPKNDPAIFALAMAAASAVPRLTPRDASAALALVTAATEPDYEVVGFFAGKGGFEKRGRSLHRGYQDGLTPLSLSPCQRLDDVVSTVSGLPFGGTDCALPMLYAKAREREIDTFVIYTDTETWAGEVHPAQALRDYRWASGIDARLVVVGMVSNGFSIADPADPGMLDVVGFDTATPQLISDFARGAL
jgi:hypothetical protein